MPNTALRLSPEGLAFIKQFQGFSAEPYRDECHLRVVGYGHLIQDKEAFDTPISHAQAEALLVLDIHACQRVLLREVRIPLAQNQYDALLSLALSIGPEQFVTSEIIHHLNRKQFTEALSLWRVDIKMNGVKSNGLNIQRQAECALFGTVGGCELIGAE